MWKDMTYNPSKRKNPKLKIKQIQEGILEYNDEIGTVLIGIETRALNNYGLNPNDVRKPHELSSVQWDVSRSLSVGNRIDLCPRDVSIFKELIKYLEDQGIIVGDDTKTKNRKRKPIYNFKYIKGKWRKVKI